MKIYKYCNDFLTFYWKFSASKSILNINVHNFVIPREFEIQNKIKLMFAPYTAH